MVRGRRLSARTLRRWVPAVLALLLTLAFGLLPPLQAPARAQPLAVGRSPATAAPSPAAPARTGEEIRAVWLTSNDMDVLRDRGRMREVVRQLAALHFNTIYPVVWNGGIAYYPSAVSERMGLQDFQYRGLQGQDILQELITEAHRQGLLVLPWFEFGFMVPPGSVLTRRQPDWLSRRRDGTLTSISAAGEVSWLNPLHPGVQTFLSDLILEIATQYDADGIQFDDHTSLPSDFGYDAYTSSLYKRSMKREPPANPTDAAWLKWRADGISAYLKQLHQQLQQKRPGFLVSLSPNYHDFAYKKQLQDWLTWLRQGSIDEVVVQLYRPDVASFAAELNRPEFQASRQRVPTAVGIFTGQRTQPVPIERVVAQAEAARQRGLGAAFFYYESLWEEAQEPPEWRKQALDALYQQPAPRRPVARLSAPAAEASAPVTSPAHTATPSARPAGTAATPSTPSAPATPAPSRPETRPSPGATMRPVTPGSTRPAVPGASPPRPPRPADRPPSVLAPTVLPQTFMPQTVEPPTPMTPTAAPPAMRSPQPWSPATPGSPGPVRTTDPADPPPDLPNPQEEPPQLDPSWGPYEFAEKLGIAFGGSVRRRVHPSRDQGSGRQLRWSPGARRGFSANSYNGAPAEPAI